MNTGYDKGNETKPMDINEAADTVLLIRDRIKGLADYKSGNVYRDKINHFKTMDLDEFMKLAMVQIKGSSEEDWKTHPQYYMALTKNLGDIIVSHSSNTDI